MSEWLSIALTAIIGYLIAGAFYGGMILLTAVSGKKPGFILSNFKEWIIGCALTLCIFLLIGPDYYKFRNLNDGSIYLTAAITVALTVFLITRKDAREHKSAREMALSGFNGLCMEMVQRFMMQPFVWWLLLQFQVPRAEYHTIIITALIWCLGILTQSLIQKGPFNKTLLLDLLSSFVFSIGIGYVFQRSGFILLTMAAHFLERILSAMINNRRINSHMR